MGGNSVEEDVNNLKSNGGNIIICTPGRLEDLLTRKYDLNLAKSLKSLVISLDIFYIHKIAKCTIFRKCLYSMKQTGC